jgi:integral membrane protein
MMNNSKQQTAWRWLLMIGSLEAISFLILLLVAVPLKYVGHNAAMVHLMGPIHGTLFLLYVVTVVIAARAFHWHRGRTWLALGASVIPFGPFLFDAWLRRQPDMDES